MPILQGQGRQVHFHFSSHIWWRWARLDYDYRQKNSSEGRVSPCFHVSPPPVLNCICSWLWKKETLTPQCQYSCEIAAFRDWLCVTSSYVILRSFYIYLDFSTSSHRNLLWNAHIAEPLWSNVIFLICPCSYLPSFISTIMSFQFIMAVSECSLRSSWATLVLCCCLEWEPCSYSVLSPSHGFTIYPFLALIVLLFDTPVSLFNPQNGQESKVSCME